MVVSAPACLPACLLVARPKSMSDLDSTSHSAVLAGWAVFRSVSEVRLPQAARIVLSTVLHLRGGIRLADGTTTRPQLSSTAERSSAAQPRACIRCCRGPVSATSHARLPVHAAHCKRSSRPPLRDTRPNQCAVARRYSHVNAVHACHAHTYQRSALNASSTSRHRAYPRGKRERRPRRAFLTACRQQHSASPTYRHTYTHTPQVSSRSRWRHSLHPTRAVTC